MNRAKPSAPAVRVAALHRQGEAWRLVVIESGSRLLEAATWSGNAGPWLADQHRRHAFDTLVRVAPPQGTITRAASVPAAGTEETLSALALLAEAQLPDSLPPHRRAAGLIADGGQNGTRAVLLTGWEGPAEPSGPFLRVPERWTTEIAALAFLRSGKGPRAANADPATGAVSVLVTGPERTAARVLIEDAESPVRFGQAAGRVISETCAAVGAEAPTRVQPGLDLDTRALAHLRATIQGMPTSAEWLNDYGLALGAALAASSTDPLSRGLAGMRAAAAIEHPSLLDRLIGVLRTPRNAWIAGGVSCAVLLLGPLALAGARLAILEAKSGGLADRTRLQADQQIRAATYEQLQRSRWPMTKLLADVSAAAPVGIVASTILMSPEQGVSIQGTAQNPEQVDTFQANLNATRLFSTVKVGRVTTSEEGVEFDLVATPVSAHAKVAKAEDFAARPLAVRLYGEGASNTAAPTGGPEREERRANRPRDVQIEEDSGERPRPPAAERESRESRRPSPSKPTEVPTPLTDEQIKAMDRSAAMKEMTARRTYSQHNPGVDAATKQRLSDEVRRIQEHMRSLNATPPAGGAG